MRLISFGDGGTSRAALVIDGRAVPLEDPRMQDLTAVVHAWPVHVERLRALSRSTSCGSGLPLSDVQLDVPFRPGRILATGGNYHDHVREMAAVVPPDPSAFLKLPGCELAPGAPLELGPHERHVDYEGEVAVVIGHEVRDASPSEVLGAIAGLMLANDVSHRDISTAHIVLAKGRRGFCPIGPMLVTPDELRLNDIHFSVQVNGELRQTGDTAQMVHGFAGIIASFSHAGPLHPGDVILTGTPSGVGLGRRPPSFLRPGDEVVVSSPQLGALPTPVVAMGEE
jgi:2-keto-4-pentenoate hydratase/2-oxohepta-3-ene-1,7-dioic acid hydratase in catechol pathway